MKVINRYVYLFSIQYFEVDDRVVLGGRYLDVCVRYIPSVLHVSSKTEKIPCISHVPGRTRSRLHILRVTYIQMRIGISHEPLSRIPLGGPSKEPVHFSEKFKFQHGTEVHCLPYTQTPFPLIEAARSLSSQAATISKDFRFDPQSLRATLVFSAYYSL